ncbi:MAG: type II toxin-antitoxin system PemK/MazF family toxin [Phycisphaerae bacterium]
MSKRTYFPERGDFVHLQFSPSAGYELAGGHYGLVLSTASFAKVTGQAFVCPITSKIRGWPLEVRVPKGILPPKEGVAVESVILSYQMKSLDFRERGMAFVAKASDDVLDETLEKVRAILDSDDVIEEMG